MLNQLPGVRLGGENNNQLKAEKNTISNILSVEPFQPKRNQTGAWTHNEIPDGAMSCATQKMFETINPPTREDMSSRSFDDSQTILGFKSVRLHKTHTLKKTIQFLKHTFPCARVIINIRSNTTAQAMSRKSAWSNKSITDLSLSIQQDNARMETIAKILGNESARLLDMVDWTREETGLQYLNDVVSWLGFRQCKFDSLYHENLNGFGRSDTRPSHLGPNCHYPESL